MLAFTDSQLRAVWAAADIVPVEKRGVFLERVVAWLELRGSFTDVDRARPVGGLMGHTDRRIGGRLDSFPCRP